MARENGEYTFTVEDLISGETYRKTVKVDEITQTEPKYEIRNLTDDDYDRYEDGHYIEPDIYSAVVLSDKQSGQPTTFDSAYVIYLGELIPLEDKNLIGTYHDFSYISTNFGFNGILIFLIEKDGTTYIGESRVWMPM